MCIIHLQHRFSSQFLLHKLSQIQVLEHIAKLVGEAGGGTGGPIVIIIVPSPLVAPSRCGRRRCRLEQDALADALKDLRFRGAGASAGAGAVRVLIAHQSIGGEAAARIRPPRAGAVPGVDLGNGELTEGCPSHGGAAATRCAEAAFRRARLKAVAAVVVVPLVSNGEPRAAAEFGGRCNGTIGADAFAHGLGLGFGLGFRLWCVHCTSRRGAEAGDRET